MTNPTDPDPMPLPALKPPVYRSYLLRFWEERGTETEPAVWRFSLEDPVTGRRHSFPALSELTAWLNRETNG